MKWTIRPLTPDLWPALEELFGKNGACNGCWCMYWRIGARYRKRLRNVNKVAFRNIVKSGPPPGLLVFDGDIAVGWCQLTPRDALPWLNKSWRLKRVDEAPVWSVSCFYVRIGYRRCGVTAALIRAALKEAERAKAPALEAYPLDAMRTPSAPVPDTRPHLHAPDLRSLLVIRHRDRSCAMNSTALLRQGQKRKRNCDLILAGRKPPSS